MLGIWEAAVKEFEEGQNFVLATILSVEGSSPRHVGTRFLVRQDGSIVGTIGGGLFEARVQKMALSALQERRSRRALFSFAGKDADATEMICGGTAEVLIEFVDSRYKQQEQIFRKILASYKGRETGYLLTQVSIPPHGDSNEPLQHLILDREGGTLGGFPGDTAVIKHVLSLGFVKPAVQFLSVPGGEHPILLEALRPAGVVYVFGGGHVGVCVVHLAAYVNFRVVVLDDRSGFLTHERVPDADQVITLDSFQKAFERILVDEDSYIVIVTRGHSHDRTVLAQALRTPAGYIGMIGSRRKNALIFEALLSQGFTPEDLARVHAPIGLAIGGETPEEIGVSIVAEMIQVRHQKNRLHQRVPHCPAAAE